MNKEKGSGTLSAAPGVQLAREPGLYSTNAPNLQPRTIPAMPSPESGKTLAAWRESLVSEGYFNAVEMVAGELGPIGLLGSPLVCVGFRDDCTLVWVCPSRCPRGWGDPFRTFLHRPGKVSGEAIRYAKKLAEYIRKAADAEQSRRERHKAAVLREKFGGAA